MATPERFTRIGSWLIDLSELVVASPRLLVFRGGAVLADEQQPGDPPPYQVVVDALEDSLGRTSITE